MLSSVPCDCRCSTLTWTKRLSRLVQHSRCSTCWGPRGWDASPFVWWPSGQTYTCSYAHLSHLLTCLPIYLLFCLPASSICFMFFLLNKMKLLYPPVHLCTHLCAGSLLVLHTMAWRWTSRSLGWATRYLSSYLPAEVSVHLFKLLLPSYWLFVVAGEYLPDADHLWSCRYSRQTVCIGNTQLPGEAGLSGSLSLLLCRHHLCQHLCPHRYILILIPILNLFETLALILIRKLIPIRILITILI